MARGKGATLDPLGYDVGTKNLGCKRQILTDTTGLLLGVVVYPARLHERDGAEAVLRQS